jgi:4-hydroxy-tetrahydrodipicolinate synthase
MARIEDGGIWAAVHTPFRADGGLDEEGIRRNVRHYADVLDLRGIFFNGLMGEFWSLTLGERQRITELIAAEAGGRLALSPNCTHHSLAETLTLMRHAKSAGCPYAVLMNPATGPRTDDALFGYFERLCAAVDIDVIVFNTPAPGYVLGLELLARLAELPNVKGLKATGTPADRDAARRAVGHRIIVSDPTEAQWLDNLTGHGQRLLYADPEPYLYQSAGHRPINRYYDLFTQGDLAGCRREFETLAPVRPVYARWITDPLRSGRMPNAALKAWAELVGLAGGPPRAPLEPLAPRERARLQAELAAAGLLPAPDAERS